MKKLTILLLCLLTVCTLIGCGAQEEAASNEITALLDEGFTASLTSYDESSWAGIFQQEDSWDTVYLVTAAMTAQQYEDFGAIGFDDEDYEAKQKNVLGQLSDVVVTDITDKVPSQEELDSYIGMTMGEMEGVGFERTGYMGDPDSGYQFFFDGPVYTLTVSVDESEAVDDLDNYSENDLRALTIGGAEFTGFSFQLLDN